MDKGERKGQVAGSALAQVGGGRAKLTHSQLLLLLLLSISTSNISQSSSTITQIISSLSFHSLIISFNPNSTLYKMTEKAYDRLPFLKLLHWLPFSLFFSQHLFILFIASPSIHSNPHTARF